MFLLFFTFLHHFLASIDPSYYASTEIVANKDSYQAVQSIKEIYNALYSADNDTLIVFDVDEVLITSREPFLHPEVEPIFLAHVQEAMSQAKTAEEQQAIEKKLSAFLVSQERYIVEPEMVSLIEELQKREKKVIALTSHPTGKFGHLESVERWKVDSLRSFGFHFEKAFPGFSSTDPLYVDGVLFSRGSNKGDVLIAFLDKLKDFAPKRVVCIDDLVKNHETLEAALRARGIAYKGYWYRRAALGEIDEAQIKAQLPHLGINASK